MLFVEQNVKGRTDSRFAWGRTAVVLASLVGCVSCLSTETQLDEDVPSAEEPAEEFRVVRAEVVEVYRAPDDLFCPGSGRSCPGLAADLDFNPARSGELWVVFRRPYSNEPCNSFEDPGCTLLRSMVATISDVTDDASEVLLREDQNSWHFMRLATSLAFADDDTFATVGEDRTGNLHSSPVDYMGPTWWSSDPRVFANPELPDFLGANGLTAPNGSHLDMLHATPYGMGIAHQRDHVFWCFNGQDGTVDRYDFNAPHAPGGEDHSDGEYHRFVPSSAESGGIGSLKRLPAVPSHMAFGPGSETLFISDTGNARVVTLSIDSAGDPESETLGRTIEVQDPQIADPREVTGASWEVLVAPGTLRAPGGIAVLGKELLVVDAEDATIHVFDLSGKPKRTIETGIPAWGLSGIVVGPDQQLYGANWEDGAVLRFDGI